MKKLFFLIVLLPFMVNAQGLPKFKLTPAGFVNASDSTKNYLVLDISGKPKAELYKSSQLYFSKLYVNPKEVMTLVDGESIILNGIDKAAIKMKVLYLNPSWDINYTTNYEFRDNKCKISISLNKISTYTGDIFREKNTNDFFNKKGEIKDEKSIKSIEDYFNLVVEKYYKSITAQKESW